MEEMKWNSDYMISIYLKIGWDESQYPLTQMGIYCFLETKHVTMSIFKDGDKFVWTGMHVNEDLDLEQYGEDFMRYDTFDEAVNAVLIETACYLSLILEKDKTDDTHI